MKIRLLKKKENKERRRIRDRRMLGMKASEKGKEKIITANQPKKNSSS